MRHRVQKNHFNRDTKARVAMVKSLLVALIEKGEVLTTKGKAKEIKRWADKLLGKAKKNDVHSRRVLHKTFGKRDLVNTLVDKIAPATGSRISGFTRIEAVGNRRGDNAEMVTLKFVDKIEGLGVLKKLVQPKKKIAKIAVAQPKMDLVSKKGKTTKTTKGIVKTRVVRTTNKGK